MLDDILLQVNKPGRYIGEEWNVSRKNFNQAEIKFALCFPDLYEIGMSNLGLRIIYGLLNDLCDVCCERFFHPAIDMQRVLRSQNLELFSLESKKSLREFDLIGFSLGYELNYTHVLNMLDLGKIPLESSLRDQRYPLVIGGGPCTLNPEPLSDFFDFFVIGEAEEVILEIIGVYQKYKERYKSAKINKQDLLLKFCQIEGVYVPSLYVVDYTPEGKISEFKPRIAGIPERIKKRIVKDLDRAYFPLNWLLPYILTVHDRITLEIMRGCPNGCRFCQARSQYFPFRLRKISRILNLACQTYRRTGYEEISLGGLSISDYPNLEKLLAELIALFKEKGVSVSLPSLRPKTVLGNVSGLIASIKKTGLTFAPEAASEKLRMVLGKDFDLQSFWKSIKEARRWGWRHIKLYFMLGLPYEEEKDLDAILDFAHDVSKIMTQLNISVNVLIPKPHTPLQWWGMDKLENIRYKQDYLKKKIRKYLPPGRQEKIKFSFHKCEMSFLEGLLSRGDRRLSQVILCAFKKGAAFDVGWDSFTFNKWQEAFCQTNIDPYFYLQTKSKDEILPWDFIDVGISKETLVKEYNKIIVRE